MASKTRLSTIDRRRFLEHTWGGVAAGLSLALVSGDDVGAAPSFGADPFTLGVASGDPTPDGIVLWTRLAPEPADPLEPRVPVRFRSAGASRPTAACAMSWPTARRWRQRRWHIRCTSRSRGCGRAATTSTSSTCAAKKAQSATFVPRRDPTPGCASCSSRSRRARIGRAATTPPTATWSSTISTWCCTWATTPTSTQSRRRLAASAASRGLRARRCVDLRTYRLRHTLHKLDPDLQAAHAKFPFAVIWDDHEVANDYSGLSPEYGTPSPAFEARRAAAYQAYYEHMPIRFAVARRPRTRTADLSAPAYGRLAEFTMLDDRQYRSDNPCGDGESLRCEAALDADYTMLGPRAGAVGGARLRALGRALEHRRRSNSCSPSSSTRRFATNWYWNDAWDGYPRARQRLLRRLSSEPPAQPDFPDRRLALDLRQRSQVDFKDSSSPILSPRSS